MSPGISRVPRAAPRISAGHPQGPGPGGARPRSRGARGRWRILRGSVPCRRLLKPANFVCSWTSPLDLLAVAAVRLEHNLDAAILLVTECPVHLRALLEA